VSTSLGIERHLTAGERPHTPGLGLRSSRNSSRIPPTACVVAPGSGRDLGDGSIFLLS